MRYTEAQIKKIAGKRWLKRNQNRFLLQLGLCIGWVVLVFVFKFKPQLGGVNVLAWVIIAPFALVIINGVFSYFRAQNRFYEKVKKNPELLK